MLNKIIEKNIVFLENYGVKINSADDKAVYKYGLQILYYYIIDLTIIFSLAYMFGKLYETAIMAFIFGLFQVFGGGYHAKTPLKCLLTMVIGIVIGNALIILMMDKFIVNIILTVIFSGFIFISKPVININHPVKKNVRYRSKIVVRISIIFFLIITFLLNYFNRNIEVTVITVTLCLYMLSLVTAKKKLLKKEV